MLSSAGLNANIQATARFEPSRIAFGNTPKYIVEITDSGTGVLSSADQITSLPIPPVAGITLRNGQTSSSQRTSLINGRAESSITQRIAIDVIPSGPGSFTIPAYTVDHKGVRLQIPAATFTVVERSAGANPTADELIFLSLEAPDQIYVGQTVQVTLQLFVEDNVTLSGYNSFERNADGFTIYGGPPEESIKSTNVANGRLYQVFNWPLKITPIRTGKQDLSFYFELSAIVPSQRNRHNGPFGNSIFEDFFGRAERFNVYTKPTQIEVLPLPTDNQPKSFSGAIGQFNIGVSVDNKSTRVNEPIMLSLKLSGTGNFERIQAPELSEADGWRSYPPESVFEVDANNELRGTKRFDYIFVPEKAGTLELPEVNFSFFDPNVEEYIELSSPAISIEVAPSNIPRVPPLVDSSMENGQPAKPAVETAQPLEPEKLLSTLDYLPHKGRSVSMNSIITPLFYWLNGGSIAILLSFAILLQQRRRLRKNPHFELLRNAREELNKAVKNANSEDVTTFYSHAKKAIRLAATIRTKSDLQTAHFAMLETQLRQSNVAETTIDQIQSFFKIADACQFSGHHQPTDLAEHRKQLKTILKGL